MKFRFRVLFPTVLLLFVLIFIFGNSLQTAPESTAISDRVLDWLSPLLGDTACTEEQLSHILRKLAHFCEFALLGLCLCFTAQAFSIPRFRLCAVGIGLLCAGADEFLQRFIEGRSSQFSDVMIDSAGVLFGLFLCFALQKIARRRGRSSS
ncbi:MAG: VanZ family protein [Clostridia bacterium]|nr:VanZ family protein [Clostridia bacterium]